MSDGRAGRMLGSMTPIGLNGSSVPVSRAEAHAVVSWFALPVAFIAFGVGLGFLGQLEDHAPFKVVLATIVVIAVGYHVRNLLDRRRLQHGEHDAANRLAETEAHLRNLVERLPAAIYRDRYDRTDGTFLEVDYVSPQMEALTGFPASEFTADADLWTKLVHPDDRDRVFAVSVLGHVSSGPLEQEYRIVRRDGRVIWVREEARVVESPGSDTILSHGMLTDVTDRKTLEQQISHLAFHDPLTALPNRALFTDRLSLALASRTRALRTAVLFLDLDGFKGVNDSLGHAAGDRLLTVVAGRLSGVLRPADTVARLGGDEFAVLLEDVDGAAGAEQVAGRLLAALRHPVEVDGRRIAPRASLGIALSGPHGTTPSELLRNADAAMYRAKAQRRGGAVLFEPGIHAEALARFDLESELRGAVAREELELVYQPIVTFSTGKVEGAEALARWTHPIRGSIPPAVFVPIAEETDLVVELGAWVLETACRQAADWLADGTVQPDFTMSVNVSARQLTEALPNQVAEILERTGLAARNLTIEVTESAVMTDASLAIDVLSRIRRQGVSVAMDDFGTGYSSLGHLRTLPIDVVKIDRSFVAAVDRPFESALVRAVVELASVLWLRTVAEGVETQDQADALVALGCDFGQGWLFGRPASAEAFAAGPAGKAGAAAEPAREAVAAA